MKISDSLYQVFAVVVSRNKINRNVQRYCQRASRYFITGILTLIPLRGVSTACYHFYYHSVRDTA